jgi:hypothetical protein
VQHGDGDVRVGRIDGPLDGTEESLITGGVDGTELSLDTAGGVTCRSVELTAGVEEIWIPKHLNK